MSKRSMHLALLAVPVAAMLGFTFGGWATITVDDLPQSLTVGQPARFGFIVRQHGITPLGDLRPVLVAANARLGAELHADARRIGADGHYEATFTPSGNGPWAIELRSGFMASNVKLIPIAAIAPGAHPAAEPAEETGRRLFVAKGCATCHFRGGVDRQVSFEIGPDLTPKRYAADYLPRFLANPTIAQPAGKQSRMPPMVLSHDELTALTAFINKP
jgi:mono/diheme cytochrome c family protein